MGWIRHHAIVVVAPDDENIIAAHAKAIELGLECTNITEPAMNGFQSFMVAPDGSKERWETSDEGDQMRLAFMDWLDDNILEDALYFTYAEVEIDTDYATAKVKRSAYDS